jgi:hypothetical protein
LKSDNWTTDNIDNWSIDYSGILKMTTNISDDCPIADTDIPKSDNWTTDNIDDWLADD